MSNPKHTLTLPLESGGSVANEQGAEVMLKDGSGEFGSIVGHIGNKYTRLTREKAQANADFVILAVNSHEELLSQLKSLIEYANGTWVPDGEGDLEANGIAPAIEALEMGGGSLDEQ